MQRLRWFSFVLVLFVLFPQFCSATISPEDPTKLSANSPLAFDGKWIYAVAADGKTLVRKQLTDRLWAAIPIEFVQVSGIAADSSFLYVADSSASAIYRIPYLNSNSDSIIPEKEILAKGPPLVSPAEITLVGSLLLVADPGAQSVIKINVHEPKADKLQLAEDIPLSGEFFLSSFQNDSILCIPDQQRILQLPHISRLTRPGWSLQTKEDVKDYQHSRLDTLLISSPDIKKPGPLSFYKGIIYVIDQGRSEIYAFSRHSFRPIRCISGKKPVQNPTRLLALEHHLLVLDGAVGKLQIWPRLVPTQIEMEIDPQSESLTSIYYYLYQKGILPTRTTSFTKNFETTLQKEGVLVAPYVTRLDYLLCDLNPKHCEKERISHILQEGSPVVIPDVFSESYIDVRRIELNGTRTLAQELDTKIHDPRFDSWKTVENLKKLNSVDESSGLELKTLTEGSYIVPIEFLRFVIPVPSEDLFQSNSDLFKIKAKYPQLDFISMEEFGVMKKHQDPPDPVRVNWDELEQLHKKMLSAIKYFVPPNLVRSSFVGVAEEEIECANPDLSQACQELPGDTHSTGVIGTVPDPTAAYQIREEEDQDHGTMVASLIGARRTEYRVKGIAAPHVLLVPIHPGSDDDLRTSLTDLTTRVFNFSFSIDPASSNPAGIHSLIKKYHDVALFVVAAGNDGKEVCNGSQEVPVCWGDYPNVLVVAATDLNGTGLLQTINRNGKTFLGSNWGRDIVHVAAPGEGFYASGRNKSYVSARGTSFATPLVTGTAALLFAEGVDDPRKIKQRIIATADYYPNLAIQGGVLNVKRAVTHPRRTLIVSRVDGEKYIEFLPAPRLEITWSDGRDGVFLKDIKRFIKVGDNFRIIYWYQHPTHGKELMIRNEVEVDPNWTFEYFELDATTFERVGDKKTGHLMNFDDFIGAID